MDCASVSKLAGWWSWISEHERFPCAPQMFDSYRVNNLIEMGCVFQRRTTKSGELSANQFEPLVSRTSRGRTMNILCEFHAPRIIRRQGSRIFDLRNACLSILNKCKLQRSQVIVFKIEFLLNYCAPLLEVNCEISRLINICTDYVSCKEAIFYFSRTWSEILI